MNIKSSTTKSSKTKIYNANNHYGYKNVTPVHITLPKDLYLEGVRYCKRKKISFSSLLKIALRKELKSLRS